MINLNSTHPVVRYGVAAAYIRAKIADQIYNLNKEDDLFALAEFALNDSLNSLVLGPNPGKIPETIHYKLISSEDLSKKSAIKRNAANGFFIAPHVLTSQNVADIIKEIYGLLKVLKEKKYGGNFELKRSFAPIISKINAGKKSMSNPKVPLFEAAYTAVATITSYKPAAFVKDINGKFSNAGLIPDLPFYEGETMPLIEFISLFRMMQSQGVGQSANIAEPRKEKKFPRPSIFYGNYPKRPQSFGLGVVSLIAAIGKWAEESEDDNTPEEVINLLENRPIYTISYNNIGQEKFSHHLTKLSKEGILHSILTSLKRVSIFGVDGGTKYSDPKWSLFIDSLDKFLLFHNKGSWQNFLAVRATYPIEFFHLLNAYFMKDGKYPQELIRAAVAYGEALNKAAYNAAKRETTTDQSRQIEGRTINEYKQRTLLQLESIVDSAKNNRDLIARLNSQVGRFTMWDIPSNAEPFLTAVTNDQVDRQDAKDLIKAFMRLSTYTPTEE